MTDTSLSRAGLARWREFFRSHDQAMLWDMLDPDCVFESPVVHTPQRGRDITFKYLASAGTILGGDGFQYVGEWLNETSAILEFTSELNGIKVNGIDMITFGPNGRIVHFKVMVRPLKAINMVHQLMAAQLQAATAAKA